MKAILILLVGWLADLLFGDPSRLPHPVVLFGRIIAAFERWLNRGRWRKAKGAVTAVVLIAAVYAGTCVLMQWLYGIHVGLYMAVGAILVFYCLAGTTLIREVREVFHAVDRSLDEVGHRCRALSAVIPPGSQRRRCVLRLLRRWQRTSATVS